VDSIGREEGSTGRVTSCPLWSLGGSNTQLYSEGAGRVSSLLPGVWVCHGRVC
jgi:hypothetical protein